MNITIRRAEAGDCARILELLADISRLHHEGRPDIFKTGSKYSAEDLTRIFAEADKPVFVAAGDSGKVEGYIFCQIIEYKDHPVSQDRKTLYIDDFCVDANVRGRGVGRALFDHAVRYAKNEGCYDVDLNVWEFNETAIRFYEALGMRAKSRKMELVL